MNKIIITLTLLLVMNAGLINAQDISWTEVAEGKKHFITMNLGADYSTNYGLSYGYSISNKYLPLIVDASFNAPFGENTFDDWNARVGLQSQLWEHNNLWWSARVSIHTNKFKSEIASLLNFGSSLSTLFAYQKPKWGIAAELAYERSEVTKIENHLTKEYYPEILDGWYNTAGGNFKFGVQAQANIKSINLFLHLGKTLGQNFKDNPTMPFYAKFGVSKSF